MFDKWLKLPAHYYLRITAFVILTVGICLHNTLMSIGAIWVMANWLIEAKFRDYWERLKRSPTIWMLLGILFLGMLSILWSEDPSYGWKDLGRKMPFFAIPFAVGLGKKIEPKIQFFILYIFMGILLLTTGINYYRYHFVLEDVHDIRQMSFFISHVRLAILTALGVFAGIYLILQRKAHWIIWVPAIGWLLFYSLMAQVLMGYLLLFILGLYSAFYLISRISSKVLKLSLGAIVVIVITSGAIWLRNEIVKYQAEVNVSLNDLERYTANGRPYYHNLEINQRENGNLVWLYVQQEEVEQEWNRRSDIPYDGTDKLGQPMFGTLLRYMTSLGLRKDSVGVWRLTENDIRKIENGIPSVSHNKGFMAKLQEFAYQWDVYQKGGDPNGHSLLQRMEHLKIAWKVVKRYPVMGVGMGDVPLAFHEEYVQGESLLTEENWHRSHNQFLTIWISHGMLGFLMLLGMMAIPFIKNPKLDYFQTVVLFALFASCLFQDLLETQAGVTIFGLFYALTVYRSSSDLSSDKIDKD